MLNYTLPPGLVEVPFKDSGHWYTHEGKYIRSVSKILNRIWPMPKDIDPYYLERGKLVHHATTLVDAGTLDMAALDHRLYPFVSAYQAFLRMAKPVVEASELVVIHPSYSFGARLDRVLRLPGQDRLIVVDIKAGTGKGDRYKYQVALCALALDEDHVADYDLGLLNLDGKGKPHLTIFDDPAALINGARKILQDDLDFLEGDAIYETKVPSVNGG
jgi:hypothetical protein